MRSVWGNLGTLILILLLFPLFILFAGPLLVLAALRGKHPLGPITLNTSQYGSSGRIGALMLGLALWLLIWGGLVWLGVTYVLPLPPTVAEIPVTTPNVVVPVETIAPTAFPTETAPPPRPTATATRVLATPILIDAPDVSPTSVEPDSDSPTIVPGSEPTLPLSPTATATSLSPTSSPTADNNQTTPVATTDPATTLTPARLSEADQQTVLATVREGNDLLRETIISVADENIENLQTIWRGRAYDKAEAFAIEHYERYAKPLEVRFEYLTPPTVSSRSTATQVIVISEENWAYGKSANAHEEAFQFIYTLTQENGQWVITNYTYRNLPRPTPTTSRP